MRRKNERFRMLADPRLQLLLCGRVAVYWLVCQITLVSVAYCMMGLESATGSTPGSPSRFLVPGLFVSSLALPLVLLEMIMFSNKFAGPLYRFEKHLRALNSGEKPPELRFRNGDRYTGLCDEFNRFRAENTDTSDAGHKRTGVEIDAQQSTQQTAEGEPTPAVGATGLQNHHCTGSPADTLQTQ